jgi:hypothetical protein
MAAMVASASASDPVAKVESARLARCDRLLTAAYHATSSKLQSQLV